MREGDTNLQKSNIHAGNEKPWDITIRDQSPASCLTGGATSISYRIPSFSTSESTTGACHQLTGVYPLGVSPATGRSLTFPHTFSAYNNDVNLFRVYVKVDKPDASCTLSFNINDPNGNVVDPSFTVVRGQVPDTPPHVSFFDFSGDISAFNANWEAFYPDDKPTREMNVKCGLNCDPELQDCSAIAGKGCLPYDAPQGNAEIKKGSCSVPSPAYDFAASKVICLFYDPSDTTLKTRVNHDFTPIDFEARTSGTISTTVGKSVELKVDITNKGLLPDSYDITITPPSTVDVLPTKITTDKIKKGNIVSAFTFVTPLVSTDGEIIITVQSLTSSKTQSLTVQLQPGLYALPEFGLTGFLQIISIAAIVYFLLVNRMYKLRKGR